MLFCIIFVSRAKDVMDKKKTFKIIFQSVAQYYDRVLPKKPINEGKVNYMT